MKPVRFDAVKRLAETHHRRRCELIERVGAVVGSVLVLSMVGCVAFILGVMFGLWCDGFLWRWR